MPSHFVVCFYKGYNKEEVLQMKTIKLVHNPSAGDEEHGKDALIKQIEDAGFECRYSSTKEGGWKEIEDEIDIIAVAGGDGTVRKVVKQILQRKTKDKTIPIAVLPLGTANNIAKTFEVNDDTEEVINSWTTAQTKKVDIGLVENVPDVDFFLEGFGFGIFPYLMKEMKKAEVLFASPDEELKAAQKKMYEIVLSYEPKYCKLEVDGTDHSGKFLLAEVMNMKSVGPNMVLAPHADPGDGEFEVVLVPEAHKQKFADFILNKFTDVEDNYQFHTLKAKAVNISWDGTHAHADDELLKLEKEIKVKIKINAGALEFLVTGNEPADR
jgi:diacylglycerol kinase family enzyme